MCFAHYCGGNLRTDNMICFFLNFTEKANPFYKVICYIEWKKNWLIAKLCTHNFLHKKTPKHLALTLCLSLSYYFNFDSLLYFPSIFKGWWKVRVGISIISYCCYRVLGFLSISNQWHFFLLSVPIIGGTPSIRERELLVFRKRNKNLFLYIETRKSLIQKTSDI